MQGDADARLKNGNAAPWTSMTPVRPCARACAHEPGADPVSPFRPVPHLANEHRPSGRTRQSVRVVSRRRNHHVVHCSRRVICCPRISRLEPNGPPQPTLAPKGGASPTRRSRRLPTLKHRTPALSPEIDLNVSGVTDSVDRRRRPSPTTRAVAKRVSLPELERRRGPRHPGTPLTDDADQASRRYNQPCLSSARPYWMSVSS